jgi:hypothetical protein
MQFSRLFSNIITHHTDPLNEDLTIEQWEDGYIPSDKDNEKIDLAVKYNDYETLDNLLSVDNKLLSTILVRAITQYNSSVVKHIMIMHSNKITSNDIGVALMCTIEKGNIIMVTNLLNHSQADASFNNHILLRMAVAQKEYQIAHILISRDEVKPSM